MTDIAWALIGTSFAVLVAFLVPVLHQLRKTAKESEQFFRRLNTQIDPLFREMTQAAGNCNVISSEVKDGVARASMLFDALGRVGESVNLVHHLVRGNAAKVAVNLASLLAGLKAATVTIKREAGVNRGGETNGSV